MIWNNVYSVLEEKPKKKMFFAIMTVVFFSLFFFLNKFELKKTKMYEGVYSCGKICTLKTIVPLEDAKKFTSFLEIKIGDTKYPLKVKEFGNMEVVQEVVAIQTITLEVPKLEYYENQTIDLEIVLEKESLFQTIMNAMKGGDA